MSLGNQIKALRERRGLTREELAARVGVTGAYLSMLESGKRGNPTREVIRKLADALGVSVAELEGEPDILAGEFPAPTLRELGLTDAFLLRYAQLWPDLNREQRTWVIGHLRIMADAERKIRALEDRPPRGEPDGSVDPPGYQDVIPGRIQMQTSTN